MAWSCREKKDVELQPRKCNKNDVYTIKSLLHNPHLVRVWVNHFLTDPLQMWRVTNKTQLLLLDDLQRCLTRWNPHLLKHLRKQRVKQSVFSPALSCEWQTEGDNCELYAAVWPAWQLKRRCVLFPGAPAAQPGQRERRGCNQMKREFNYTLIDVMKNYSYKWRGEGDGTSGSVGLKETISVWKLTVISLSPRLVYSCGYQMHGIKKPVRIYYTQTVSFTLPQARQPISDKSLPNMAKSVRKKTGGEYPSLLTQHTFLAKGIIAQGAFQWLQRGDQEADLRLRLHLYYLCWRKTYSGPKIWSWLPIF